MPICLVICTSLKQINLYIYMSADYRAGILYAYSYGRNATDQWLCLIDRFHLEGELVNILIITFQ